MSMLAKGAAQAQQCAKNAELVNSAPYGGMGRDELSARRRANEAEMRFRIEKGYEKDNLLTKIKYRLKRD